MMHARPQLQHPGLCALGKGPCQRARQVSSFNSVRAAAPSRRGSGGPPGVAPGACAGLPEPRDASEFRVGTKPRDRLAARVNLL